SGWPDDIVCSVCGTAIEPTSIPLGNIFNQTFVTNRFGTPASTAKKPGGGIDASCLAACVKHDSWGATPFETIVQECLEACEEQPGGGVKGSGDGNGGVPAGDGEDGLDPCEDISALNVQSEIELDCDEATPTVKLRVCGGDGNYTWTVSGGEGTPEVVTSGGWGQVITVKPPINDPSVAGTAYTARGCCNGTPPGNAQAFAQFGCDEALVSCGRGGPEECPGYPEICSCTTPVDCSGDTGLCSGSVACLRSCAETLSNSPGSGQIEDDRTQGMIDDGCVPCTLAMDGVTITVTDGTGTSVVTII
ncbi:hypothetical protein LCGC14_2757720, partial [marine sediment metagenome]